MHPCPNLPASVALQVNTMVEALTNALGDQLVSILLYGSAAEGRLRAVSDVNMMVVIKTFDQARIDAIRAPFRTAHAAVRLDILFLLESEIGHATAAFAVKFDDIATRHCMLYGTNPFETTVLSRDAAISRLQQVLLNLRMRLRERYALVSLREEQLADVIAEFSGPVRVCAATLLKLEGHPALSPKDALKRFVELTGEPRWEGLLTAISESRENQYLSPGKAPGLIFQLMELTEVMETRIRSLQFKP